MPDIILLPTIVLLGVVFVVVATTRYKLHPFLALLIAAFGIGLASGVPLEKIVPAITGGLGRTTGTIGLVIACGAIIGVMLEHSGGALVLAESALALIGRARAVLAMAFTGAVVSVPVFCDSGYVLLSPLNRALARQTGVSVAAFATALGMGLYSTHCLVPPTPGPVAAAGELRASLGGVILLGLVVAVPVVLVATLYARYLGRRLLVNGASEAPAATAPAESVPHRPGRLAAFLPLVAPVALIALKSVAEFPGSPLAFARTALGFLGEPNVALLAGLILAVPLARRHGREVFSDWCGEGIRAAGTIILITAAGGALGAVLRETAMARLISEAFAGWSGGRTSLLLPFLIAAALKTALGSSTVSMITTASLVSPLLGSLGLAAGHGPTLATLAIASGAMIASHVNDSYFWVITQMSGLSVAQGYRVVTVASVISGCVAMATVWLLSLFLL